MKRIGAVRRHIVHFLAVLLRFLFDPLLVLMRQVLFGVGFLLIHLQPPFQMQRRGVGTAPHGAGLGKMAPTAQEATRKPGGGRSVIGWRLDREQRRELLQQFPPIYGNVVADHVTLQAKVARDAPLPGPVHGEIVGRADDGKGVEAMVVSIDGSTDRPDGSTYHITWSLAEGRRPVESNDVIRERGWKEIELPMPVKLEPTHWP
jgi:hypothetical protein